MRADAVTFDADIMRRRALGPQLIAELDRQSLTLDAYVRGPRRAHAATLAQPTRDKYGWALGKHLGELVDEPLLAIDAPVVAAHQQRLLSRGATPSTVREVIAKFSGILQIATEHVYIPANPARAVRNVPVEHGEEIDPLTPAELERLLAMLRGRDRAIAQLGGHFGLRPQEIRQVPCTTLLDGALTIGRAQTKASALVRHPRRGRGGPRAAGVATGVRRPWRRADRR